ncbi:uncharacterized protein Dwil_GK15702 [Drosophila willistoni]|uniref:Uncharacterized protein n=1 Tax=Drosophila willistoni TaxID=7260 RepID=B4MRR9_DROWI|nr:uncharacterized protein LOC6640785 [Drosophila willistoni]EDW74808.1 uncharacterized protein Dwil_GK15702 [Drosophila willistoni]
MFMQESANILRIEQHLTKCWNKVFELNETKNYQFLKNLNTIINESRMAAIPQGAFAACKIREYNERDMIVSRMKLSATDKNAGINLQTQRDYSPVKYNDKLMNSIWGLYNRYSPHNVKKNEYAPRKL